MEQDATALPAPASGIAEGDTQHVQVMDGVDLLLTLAFDGTAQRTDAVIHEVKRLCSNSGAPASA